MGGLVPRAAVVTVAYRASLLGTLVRPQCAEAHLNVCVTKKPCLASYLCLGWGQHSL